HEFRPGSGGDGQYRGGVGAVLRLRVDSDEPGVANTAGDGERHAPYGLLGGQDGLPHRYRLLSGRRGRVLKTKEVGITVQPGDVFVVESSGGGGYGPPARRRADARAADVANEFVSPRAGSRGRSARGVVARGRSSTRKRGGR
ncbi:MAG: hydantoinase B/oxoprolinase family protein, partial [Candidatus Eiseniibacteriota bacterium]